MCSGSGGISQVMNDAKAGKKGSALPLAMTIFAANRGAFQNTTSSTGSGSAAASQRRKLAVGARPAVTGVAG